MHKKSSKHNILRLYRRVPFEEMTCTLSANKRCSYAVNEASQKHHM